MDCFGKILHQHTLWLVRGNARQSSTLVGTTDSINALTGRMSDSLRNSAFLSAKAVEIGRLTLGIMDFTNHSP
jgi:hypothetical protein